MFVLKEEMAARDKVRLLQEGKEGNLENQDNFYRLISINMWTRHLIFGVRLAKTEKT